MTGVNGDIRITTLVENVVYGKGLQGEHGLSLLVEVGERKVLFDTGASDLFIRNSRLMGIDLREVDYLVLSHGHRDHTGGLHHFLRLNERATVVCKREALRPKFKDERENGLMHPDTLDIARFRFVEDVLSACSHRGITNILRMVLDTFPDANLRLVLGGFHIRTCGAGKNEVIARYLADHLPQRLGVCHCTGIDQYALFYQIFTDRLFYNYTGWVETF